MIRRQPGSTLIPYTTLFRSDNLAETSAKAISNIKFDKVIVRENGGSDGNGSTAGFLSSMANTLPPMLQVMKDIGGIEMPETIAKISGDEGDDSGEKSAVRGSSAVKARASKPKPKAE